MQTSIGQELRTFVVLNPVAGQREPEVVHELVESRLRASQPEFEIYETTGQENIRRVVEQAVQRGAKMVLACGGDGTVSAAASGMVGKDALFGIIPAGTWNALARNLNIPIDLEDALDLALGEHSVRVIDVLETGGNYFILNVSTGTGALILRTIEREEIRKLGRFTYLWKGFLQVMGYPPHRFDLVYDGKATSFRASEVIIANSGVIGINNMRLDLDIHLDDGRFSICRINATSLLDYVQIGFNMLTGKQHKDPRLVCWQTGQSVRISSSKRMPVQADGELIGYLPVEVKLVPKALRVIIPPPGPQE